MNSTNTLFLDHDKLEDDDDDDEGDLVEGVKIKIKKAMRCDSDGDYGTGILSKVVDLYLLILPSCPVRNIGEINGS